MTTSTRLEQTMINLIFEVTDLDSIIKLKEWFRFQLNTFFFSYFARSSPSPYTTYFWFHFVGWLWRESSSIFCLWRFSEPKLGQREIELFSLRLVGVSVFLIADCSHLIPWGKVCFRAELPLRLIQISLCNKRVGSFLIYPYWKNMIFRVLGSFLSLSFSIACVPLG